MRCLHEDADPGGILSPRCFESDLKVDGENCVFDGLVEYSR